MTSAVAAASSANILAGQAGGVSAFDLMWAADSDAAVPPTDASTALDGSFLSLGMVTPDGNSVGTAITSTDIPVFGSYQPALTLIQTETITITTTALETNAVVAAIKTRQAIADIVVGTGGVLSLTRGPARDTHYAFVIDSVFGAAHIRKFYPSVRLTTLGDQPTNFGAAQSYPFTFTAYPDDSGNSEYEYILNVNLPVTV